MNMMIVSAAATLAAPGAALPNFSSLGASPDATVAAKRAAEIVRVLGTYHVRDGWRIDDDAAGCALAWFNGRVTGRVSDDEPMTDEGMAAMRFLGDHGQSLDWVFMGDTTGMICAGAAHSKQAARSVTAADPIFAAIEAHRAAVSRHLALQEEEFRLEEELPANRRRWSWNSEEPLDDAAKRDDQRWLENCVQSHAAFQHMDAVAADLINIRATTVKGAAALLTYVKAELARGHGILPPNMGDDYPEVEGNPLAEHEWLVLLLGSVAGALGEVPHAA